MPDDFQRKRAYRWENTFWLSHTHSETCADLRKLIRRACRLYSIEVPAIRFLSKALDRNDSEYLCHTITLNYYHCNRMAALHEAAHAIVEDRYDNEPQHGERWLGIYLRLLEWAKVAPRVALHASAHAEGLRWIDVKP